MAEAEVVALVIYDSVLFNRTGQVRRWADAVERGFVFNAKKAAPSRSGALRAGIWGNVERIGPVHLQTIIQSDSEHTMYVLKGTTGPIMTDRMWEEGERKAMKLRPGGGYPEQYAFTVEGQFPNNFFEKAAEATARRHPSLRGFDPDFVF